MKYTIIGAGAAGLAAARAIRHEELKAEITIISDEPAPFYFRPMLVELFGRDQFTHNITQPPQSLESAHWKLGARVKQVDAKAKQVTLSTGEIIGYDFLILASGSIPDLDFTWSFRQFIHTVHSYTDMVRLKQTLKKGNVLVVGGGYVAVEIIRQLRLLNHRVIYFARPDWFWSRELPGVTAHDVEQLLTNAEVPPQFGYEIEDVIDLDGKALRVANNHNNTYEVVTIIAAPAETPNVAYLEGSGIICKDGVIVNEELRTNIPNVFACGDCAQVLDVRHQINRINFGWRSAEKQGEIAGLNAVGRSMVYVPNSDDFYFLDLLGKSLFDRWAGEGSAAEK